MEGYFEVFRDLNFSMHLATEINNNFDAHYHSNIEITFVEEGEIEITVGKYTDVLKAGELSVADSYDCHSYTTPKYSKTKIMIIPLEMVGSFARLSKQRTFSYPFCRDKKVTTEIAKMISGLERADENNALASKGYLYVILGLLCASLGVRERAGAEGGAGAMRDMLLYIEQHFRESVTISLLAKKFGYNRDYLSRLFNSTLGIGFRKHVNILRSRSAANLLRDTGDPISDIAYSSGFSSQRTFNRAFRDLYGVTPAEYRAGF